MLEVETVGVMFWDVPSGRMTDANDAFLRLIGYSRREMEDGGLTWRTLTPPEYVEASVAEIRKFVETGHIGPYEKEYFRKDGTRFWLLIAGSSLGHNTCVEFCVDISTWKKAEVALRVSEARFSAFMSHLPAAAWIKDAEGCYVYANAEAARVFSRNQAELLGRTDRDLFPSETARAFRENDHRALAEGGAIQTTEVLTEADGIEHHSIVSKFAIPEGGGGALIGGVAFDITERREAEQQLARELDAMTRLQKLGMLLVKEGELEPILTDILDSAIAISGAEFGNIQMLDPVSGDLRIAAQRGLPPWWLEFWDMVSKSKGSCGTALERGERVIVEDVEQSPIFAGTPALDIQRRAGIRAVQSTPLISRSGRPVGMFSTHYRTPRQPDEHQLRLLDLLARQAADIIERTQTEEALRQRAEMLRLSFDAIIVWRLDDGSIESWNRGAEELYGFTEADARGRNTHDLLHTVHPIPWQEVLAALKAHGRWEGDLIHHARDGREVMISCRKLLIHGADRIDRVLETNRDITDRKRAESQLETSLHELRDTQKELMRKERLAVLGKLAGSVAHEIRTPLAVIRNSVVFLESYLETGDETIRDVLAEMNRAVGNSNHIISEMLDYVREPAPLSTVFQVGDAISNALREVSVPESIRVEGCRPAIAVTGNPDQVKRILLNLIQNAVQAMPQGGDLQMSAQRQADGKVSILVRDTGCGIPEENLDKIFEPLFSTKTKGIGLGLAIARRYAHLNGGDLSVASEVGRGTTFRLTLPAA